MNYKDLGQWIDIQSKLKTTQQVISLMRRTGISDSDIRESLNHCATGNKLAIEQILGKVPTKFTLIERERDENKDVLEQE